MADRAEVEEAFKEYVRVGLVGEDWEAWTKLFTEDATYFDHFYGTFTGHDEILRYIEGTMGAAPHVYSVLVWYNVDGDRVVYQIVNRADNPEPGAPPIDFPSWQVIQYAGDGRWKSEEDIWVMGEMKTFARTYSEAALRHPQSLDERLSRKDWGPWVDWARPEPGHVARPSWYDRPDWKPLAYNDIDFGIRSH
ncbi:nuclear transport factor 2 family protein [Gordonia insulae]|jgi:ketosteroid isomerase-like protein|uniref:SnoaL-like domain-containing protein n=1 Tax=Gordonia insulae TaxID=2420509 RepID=A0A3G8JK08_9ACTN|nr:nuclear transport factor 2 family protein [Gordonia insulae]AZG45421.1 hypothetical protein D7316_02017 [Gordonia insulae]